MRFIENEPMSNEIKEKVKVPVKRCENPDHFSNVLVFGVCPSCKRKSLSSYDREN